MPMMAVANADCDAAARSTASAAASRTCGAATADGGANAARTARIKPAASPLPATLPIDTTNVSPPAGNTSAHALSAQRRFAGTSNASTPGSLPDSVHAFALSACVMSERPFDS
jgi:hypothetical protein